MYLSYVVAGESGRQARQVYEDGYPDSRIPQQETFARMHRYLYEHGSLSSNMHDTGRRRLTWTVNIKEQLLQSFKGNPNTTRRAIA
ncbi:hypothetical protein TNCT_698321 [Trichonephila clavata]|uniref:DUF4817 domain-containing protein n=1 Tax=Trichonephila clavata TaxID=2740835 RepID=A0A8X6G0W1_TRICU|nr:hypothetical protein TNCT_698321 [Trichonephila clavata]